MESERDLRTEFRGALDAVLPPVPWLETAVMQHLRKELRSDWQADRIGSTRRRLHLDSSRKSRVLSVRHRMELAAGIAAVVLAAIVIGTFAYIRAGTHPQTVAPPKHAVETSNPVPVNPPTAMDCPANCSTVAVTFASLNVIWAIVEPSAPGPANIFRSNDGGQSWHAQASWYNPVPYSSMEHMTVTSDGKEALFVAPDWTVLHTSDGGAHWSGFQLPLTAKPNQLFQTYFLNPREGWLVSPDPTPQVDDLFHTIDSGANWILSGHVATSTAFDLLHGQLVFQTSSAGWFVPNYTGSPLIARTVYRTLDGGLTWYPKALEPLSVTTEQNKPGSVIPVHAAIVDLRFFNSREGVIELQSGTYCGGVPNGPQTFCAGDYYGPMAVYATSDGGETWSAPRLIPSVTTINFIDANHWVETGLFAGGNSLARTSDGGKSWENVQPVFESVPARDPQRALQLIQFVDPSHGLAWITCPAILIRTDDGGGHWAPLSVPSNQPIGSGGCGIF